MMNEEKNRGNAPKRMSLEKSSGTMTLRIQAVLRKFRLKVRKEIQQSKVLSTGIYAYSWITDGKQLQR